MAEAAEPTKRTSRLHSAAAGACRHSNKHETFRLIDNKRDSTRGGTQVARISPGTMTAAIFAILIGLGGAYAVRQYLHKPVPVVEQKAEANVVVPVAARDLVAGQTLTVNDIVVHRFSQSEFRKSEYAKKTYMSNTEQIAGRTLRVDVKTGGLFDPAILYPDGMGPGVADQLRPGFRAVSVPINDIGSVAGFARPGSVVDVLFRSESRDGYPETTMTLLERVEVLAINHAVIPGARGDQAVQNNVPAKVTLAVTPAQAKALKVVEGRGEMSLALRNPEEAEDELISLNMKRTSTRVTLDQLLGPPRRNSKMEIYRGGVKEVLNFEDSLPEDQLDETIINTPIAADSPSVVKPAFQPMPLSGYPATTTAGN